MRTVQQRYDVIMDKDTTVHLDTNTAFAQGSTIRYSAPREHGSGLLDMKEEYCPSVLDPCVSPAQEAFAISRTFAAAQGYPILQNKEVRDGHGVGTESLLSDLNILLFLATDERYGDRESGVSALSSLSLLVTVQH